MALQDDIERVTAQNRARAAAARARAAAAKPIPTMPGAQAVPPPESFPGTQAAAVDESLRRAGAAQGAPAASPEAARAAQFRAAQAKMDTAEGLRRTSAAAAAPATPTATNPYSAMSKMDAGAAAKAGVRKAAEAVGPKVVSGVAGTVKSVGKASPYVAGGLAAADVVDVATDPNKTKTDVATEVVSQGTKLTGAGIGALYGGAKGTAAGAAIGSVVPVLGTGVGAAVGGTLGALAGGYAGWKGTDGLIKGGRSLAGTDTADPSETSRGVVTKGLESVGLREPPPGTMPAAAVPAATSANQTAEYAKRLGMNSLTTPSVAGAGRGIGPDAELRNLSRDMTAELSGRPGGRLPQLPSDLREGVVHKTIDPKTGAVTYSGRNVGANAEGQTQFVNGKGETIQPRGSIEYAAAGAPVSMTGAGGGGVAFTPSNKMGAGAGAGAQQQGAQADQTPQTASQQPSGPTPSATSPIDNGMSGVAARSDVSAALQAAAARGDMDSVRAFYQQNGGTFGGRTAAQDQAEEQTRRDNSSREWANNALRNSYDPRYDRGAGAEARINSEKAGAEKVLKDLDAKAKGATEAKLADAQMTHYRAQEANANAQLGLNGLRAQIEMSKYTAEQGEKRAQTSDKLIDDYFKIPKTNDKGQVIGFENNDVARNEFQKRMAEKGIDPTKMTRAELQRTMRDFGMVSDMNQSVNQKVASERGTSGITQNELQDPASYSMRGMRFSDIYTDKNAVSVGDWASGLFKGSEDISNQVLVDKFGQVVPAEVGMRRSDGTLNADMLRMYQEQKAKKAQ